MYLPAHFRVEDREILHAFIRAHPLGLLVSAGGNGSVADLLPFELVEGAANGMLRAHMARVNPQRSLIETSGRAFVVFQASGHYISPGWYPSKAEHGRVVPTWNYVIVQVSGSARIVEEAGWLRQQVSSLTQRHEGRGPDAWSIEDAPGPFIEAQLKAISGLEIDIEMIEGKFKLSQNRPQGDRKAVRGMLEQKDGAGADIASIMRTLGIGD